MSKEEILTELGKLPVEERRQVRARLAELDDGEWLDDGLLTTQEKNIIEARFADLEENPGASVSWEDAKAELLSVLKR